MVCVPIYLNTSEDESQSLLGLKGKNLYELIKLNKMLHSKDVCECVYIIEIPFF